MESGVVVKEHGVCAAQSEFDFWRWKKCFALTMGVCKVYAGCMVYGVCVVHGPILQKRRQTLVQGFSKSYQGIKNTPPKQINMPNKNFMHFNYVNRQNYILLENQPLIYQKNNIFCVRSCWFEIHMKKSFVDIKQLGV